VLSGAFPFLLLGTLQEVHVCPMSVKFTALPPDAQTLAGI